MSGRVQHLAERVFVYSTPRLCFLSPVQGLQLNRYKRHPDIAPVLAQEQTRLASLLKLIMAIAGIGLVLSVIAHVAALAGLAVSVGCPDRPS